jgi:hypothetical protein
MPHQRPPPRHLSFFEKPPHLPQTKDVDIHTPPSILAQLLRGAASRPASTPPPPSSALPPPSSRAAASHTHRPLRSISAASDPPRRPTAGAASTCAAATLTAGATKAARATPSPRGADGTGAPIWRSREVSCHFLSLALQSPSMDAMVVCPQLLLLHL